MSVQVDCPSAHQLLKFKMCPCLIEIDVMTSPRWKN